jgi:hypothetical protein
MTNRKSLFVGLLILALRGTGAAQGDKVAANAQPGGVQVHMVVNVEPLKDSDDIPSLSREDVQVKQGKNSLPVTAWVPGRAENAALQLFLLIDETSDASLGLQLDDLRAFVQAQPATTMIGLGYMRNTTVNIVQNFTADHAQIAKTLRLPLSNTGASDSPYLSLVSLLKGWPESKVRREVIMISDGIDRLRGFNTPSGMAPMQPGMAQPGRFMPYISPDVDQASRAAQRAGVIIHSIYTQGVGHVGRNFYDVNNGQNCLSKVSDETGGESFMLGVQNVPSFKPYLDRIQRILDNQYFLAFQAQPGKKGELRRVKISTELPKVEIVAADNVWVPAASAPVAKAK